MTSDGKPSDENPDPETKTENNQSLPMKAEQCSKCAKCVETNKNDKQKLNENKHHPEILEKCPNSAEIVVEILNEVIETIFESSSDESPSPKSTVDQNSSIIHSSPESSGSSEDKNDSGIDMTMYTKTVEEKTDEEIPSKDTKDKNKSSNNIFGEVKLRRTRSFCCQDKKNDEYKTIHRKTSVVLDEVEDFSNRKSVSSDSIGNSNRGSLYSVEEYDEENEEYVSNYDNLDRSFKPICAVNTVLVNNKSIGVSATEDKQQKEGKVRKKSIFSNIFHKKSNKVSKKGPPEPHVKNSHESVKPVKSSLANSKKYCSAVDIRDKSFSTQQPSLTKRISNFLHKDGSSIIRRSLSFRDIRRKKDKDISREKLAEMKNKEWAASLQSLVESDIGISYDDLSFVNYDAQNSLLTEKIEPVRENFDRNQSLLKPNRAILRSQSLYEHGTTRSPVKRVSTGSSFPRHSQSAVELSSSGSENTLTILNETCPAEEGCTDATTEIKENSPIVEKIYVKDEDHLFYIGHPMRQISVRSRSLNQLDNLETRQKMAYPSDSTLKDSRSEPDCTRSLTTISPRTTYTSDNQPTHTRNDRKHVLTRSQKSSSECFSVNFEVGDESTWDNELFFPAIRGVTLFDSLSKLCELRNLSLNSCEAWLQDKENNTSTRVSFSQDTKILVGRNIVITAKDAAPSKREGPSKKLSSNKQSRSSLSSSVDYSTPSNICFSHQDSRLSVQDFEASKRQSKQRWSGLFSNSKDNSKMESLSEQLNYYAKYGVPTSQVYPRGQCESIDALYKLENDWKEIIDVDGLCEKYQQQQTALWELIKTEVAYIRTLKVVTDLFLACLQDLQSASLLKEIDTDKLFSNITEILDANVLFWRNSLFPLVRDMRKYKQPPCIENMCEGFLKIKEIFQPYFRYCSEQARCQHYCRENHAHNELFTAYLAWCETQRECNRLRLMDILVQPMQRLTKYGLLLKAILKNTDDDVERDNLTLMIKSVDDFVNNVNISLKRKQDNERIKGIIARIESYDVVESKDDDLERLLKSYCRLDLNKPMVGCSSERRRHLILEGDLKIKDSSASKTEVHCFLLTDMLLICKPSTKKGGATMRVIRQPYIIDRLLVTELNRETPSLACIYRNEFDMATAAFILQNNDAKKLKVWKESIIKAQSLYSQAKKVNQTIDENMDPEYGIDYSLENDYHNLQLAPRSPLPGSSRSSRVSSLAHSHSGSVEINEQSSLGSVGNPCHIPSGAETTENRTASISSDEGVQPLPPDKSPVTHKSSFKQRMMSKTPNTLSVQPYGALGQSLPNLTLGSLNVGTLSLNLNQNTLLVPSTTKNGGHLLSPTHRGISYPPPSPTRGNLKRGLAISQNKNPPLIKTRHVTSTCTSGTAASAGEVPTSFDFGVPVIPGISIRNNPNHISQRQGTIRNDKGDIRRCRSSGVVEEVSRIENKDLTVPKKLSWSSSSEKLEDQT